MPKKPQLLCESTNYSSKIVLSPTQILKLLYYNNKLSSTPPFLPSSPLNSPLTSNRIKYSIKTMTLFPNQLTNSWISSMPINESMPQHLFVENLLQISLLLTYQAFLDFLTLTHIRMLSDNNNFSLILFNPLFHSTPRHRACKPNKTFKLVVIPKPIITSTFLNRLPLTQVKTYSMMFPSPLQTPKTTPNLTPLFARCYNASNSHRKVLPTTRLLHLN